MLHAKRLANDSPELLGIGLKVSSGIGFAIMSGIIKFLGEGIPLGQVVFFRSAVALIPLIVFLLMTSDFPSGLKTKYPGKHITRCVFGTLAMFCAFGTLRYLPLAEATAISYLSPVILVIFAIFLLKEKVNPRRMWGVILGVLGLAFMTVPNFTVNMDRNTLIGIGLAVMAAVLIAAALLQVRKLSQMGENPAAIAFYFAITSTVIGTVSMLDNFVMPTLIQLFSLICIGLLGGVAQILMTMAFKYAEASAMAPYDYLSIVWAVIIGFLAFAEVPDMIFWMAMPLILLGAIIAKPKARAKMT